MKPSTGNQAKRPFENLTGKIRAIAGIVAGHHKLAAEEKDRELAARHRKERDQVEMLPSQCSVCQHYRPWFRGRTTCDAYPDDIPVEILRNRIDHHAAYVGDHGLRYKAINPEDDIEDGLEDRIGTEDDDATLDPR
jgi:hypothetical protein